MPDIKQKKDEKPIRFPVITMRTNAAFAALYRVGVGSNYARFNFPIDFFCAAK